MTNSTACSSSADRQFGPQVDSDCRPFDFTLFFEDAIFVALPTAIFLLLLPARLRALRKEPVKSQSYKLLTWKLLLLAVLFVLHLCFLILCLTTDTLETEFSISSGVLAAVAIVAAAVQSFIEDQHSVKPSDLLVLYFSASTLLYIPRLRTLWLIPSVSTARGLWTTIFILTTVTLFVESARKTRMLRPLYQNATKEQMSGFWAQSFYTWVLPFFHTGYSTVLDLSNMPEIDEGLREETAGRRLETSWQKARGRHRLLRATFRAYIWPLVSGIVPRLALTAFTFCQPFLIETTVIFMGSKEKHVPKSHGDALIGAFVLTYLGIATSRAVYMRQTNRMITMMRSGLISIIYRHTTPLKANDLKDSAAITLMGTDVERIVVSMKNVHELWVSVPEIGVAVYLLSRQVSVASIVPPIICVASLLAIAPVSARFGSAQKQWVEKVEKRIAVTANMLSDMRAVKMLGFANILQDAVRHLRLVELKTSETFRKLLIWRIVISNAPGDLAPFATFTAYAIYGVTTNNGTLLSSQAFASLSLIALLTHPLLMFCQALPNFVQAVACFTRIEKYCLKSAADLSSPSSRTLNLGSSEDGMALTQYGSAPGVNDDLLSFVSADCSWTEDSDVVLRGLTVKIHRGITTIIGPVASGKSTLLASIVGEAVKRSGTVTTSISRTAFCSQTPWIMNSTVRHNIIGGLDFDQKWYNFTLWACCLQQDLEALPDGDMSEAGSNGSSLSGGQRQRVSLAQAVYSRLPVVILDDVLSGLDPTTLGLILDRLLGSDGHFRKAGFSVILATHSRRALPLSDNIIVLNEGQLVDNGSYEQICLRAPHLVVQSVSNADTDITEHQQNEKQPEMRSKLTSEILEEPTALQEADPNRRDGTWLVYVYYYRGAGTIPVLLWLLFTFVEAFATNYTTVWLNEWSEANEKKPNKDLGLYLGVYAMLFVVATVAIFSECWVFFVRIINNTAMSLHSDLLEATLRAPYSFFQTTDTGTITNRFSQDMDLIDMTLPSYAIQFVTAASSCIVKLAILCVLGKYLAASVPVLAVALFFIQRYYLRTSRQVRLIDIEAKAPLYKHLIETVKGITTIRAFNWESSFQDQNSAMLDSAQRPFYMLKCIQQWLTLVLDLVVGALAVVLVAIATNLTGTLSAGEVGVALNVILSFNSLLTQAIESWTQLETSIGAVARVQTFVRDTPSEASELDHPASAGETWPSLGAVRFENVTSSYGVDKPSVLRNLNLSLRAGEKLAICGPSGSGKSSLILSLLQMMDVRHGRITIDGTDITTIAPSVIRSRLNVVPQEPFFMPGTVRFNLNPYSRSTDESVEMAIRKVGLWMRIGANGGLDMELEAAEWSHGERQLLCLARALLVPSKILILDEATSSVDEETEAVMQGVIEAEFKEHTIISVLHRFKNIDGFDRVAVLSTGDLIECDTPKRLLSSDSAFRKLYVAHHSGHN